MDLPLAIANEGVVENLTAVAVIGGAFLLGVRWILHHVSKLQDQNFKIMTDLLEKNHTALGEVTEVLRQNNTLLGVVTGKIERCGVAERARAGAGSSPRKETPR